jgi:hypothetical protein
MTVGGGTEQLAVVEGQTGIGHPPAHGQAYADTSRSATCRRDASAAAHRTACSAHSEPSTPATTARPALATCIGCSSRRAPRLDDEAIDQYRLRASSGGAFRPGATGRGIRPCRTGPPPLTACASTDHDRLGFRPDRGGCDE